MLGRDRLVVRQEQGRLPGARASPRAGPQPLEPRVGETHVVLPRLDAVEQEQLPTAELERAAAPAADAESRSRRPLADEAGVVVVIAENRVSGHLEGPREGSRREFRTAPRAPRSAMSLNDGRVGTAAALVRAASFISYVGPSLACDRPTPVSAAGPQGGRRKRYCSECRSFRVAKRATQPRPAKSRRPQSGRTDPAAPQRLRSRMRLLRATRVSLLTDADMARAGGALGDGRRSFAVHENARPAPPRGRMRRRARTRESSDSAVTRRAPRLGSRAAMAPLPCVPGDLYSPDAPRSALGAAARGGRRVYQTALLRRL